MMMIGNYNNDLVNIVYTICEIPRLAIDLTRNQFKK